MTKMTPARLSAGIDYNYPLHGRYEYVLFDDHENIVARKSGFKSKAQAQRHGFKAAEEILAALPAEG